VDPTCVLVNSALTKNSFRAQISEENKNDDLRRRGSDDGNDQM